jgi:sorbitol/mannitol transport system substrate-binding protein
VTIPEFQAIGTQVGKLFSAALIGQTTVDQAWRPRSKPQSAR